MFSNGDILIDSYDHSEQYCTDAKANEMIAYVLPEDAGFVSPIFLCPKFFEDPDYYQSSTLAHEMTHMSSVVGHNFKTFDISYEVHG